MIVGVGRSIYRRMFAKSSRKEQRAYWEEQWGRQDFAPPWLGRDVSKEIVSAVREGWFPAGGRALDIGCGQGEVVAWLAQQGYPVLGVDIAAAAVERARARYGQIPGRLEFQTLDICAEVPCRHAFSIVVDRGCFHQISPHDSSKYLKNVARACSATAHLLLFIKAFRGNAAIGDPLERECAVARIQAVFSSVFSIDRVAETFLDPFQGQRPDRVLPGLGFWMSRH